MFKVHPIRANCPIKTCKGQFISESALDEKPKKKGGDDGEIVIEPHIMKLYNMTFTKRMINHELVDYIRKESPHELFLQEMKLAERGVLLNDIAVQFEYGNHY